LTYFFLYLFRKLLDVATWEIWHQSHWNVFLYKFLLWLPNDFPNSRKLFSLNVGWWDQAKLKLIWDLARPARTWKFVREKLTSRVRFCLSLEAAKRNTEKKDNKNVYQLLDCIYLCTRVCWIANGWSLVTSRGFLHFII